MVLLNNSQKKAGVLVFINKSPRAMAVDHNASKAAFISSARGSPTNRTFRLCSVVSPTVAEGTGLSLSHTKVYLQDLIIFITWDVSAAWAKLAFGRINTKPITIKAQNQILLFFLI
jgi:hypothetical protein